MKNIDKNVVMLGWVSFFTDMASAMINPILPIFVVVVLHQGMDKLGIIVAIATFVSYALRLLSGYISDWYGIVKPLVVGGYALSALSKPLIGFSHGYKSVAALKAFERLGKGMRSAPKDLMISSYSKANASGKTFGFHKTMDIAGELSGTLILFGLLWYFGQSETVIRTVFYATLIPGIIGLIIVAFFVRDIPKSVIPSKQTFMLTKRDKQTIVSLLFYFLFLLFVFSDAFFTMQAKEVGIATALIPLLFVVSTATQTLTSYTFGIFIDRIGAKHVLLFAYVCGVAAQGLLYLHDPIFTWVAYAFLGLFTVASLNANRAFISEHADNRGSVYGVFYAGVALFGAVGAYISGMIWEHFGMQSSLLFSLAGTSLLMLLFTVRYYGRS
ncbi:MFS transporter [Sulfurovum lithotrophicum]|uniref:MFS transporter n=1 Tax=Sulfurovum lithotrophicum TaxID=206403 RepID=A0A7U4M2D6_9BACT|nr:MFS transporter [Sulfurovum lithotrophicum]AKF25614.1 MFS transporter [Sulfurovum lithotrophicum]